MQQREDYGQFDYVIVGAGTAGCALANRLSADPRNQVLLLEAGGSDNYIWTKIPVGYLYCMGNPRTDWGFKTAPADGLNGRSLNYPRGRVMGGCSSINGMIYMRGQARDYDHWAQMGNQGWSWDEVLPYFKKSEDYYAGGDEMHGSGGEWRVEEQRLSWEILDHFKQACIQAGIPETSDFNRGNNEGVGYFHVNQRKGWRWSSATAFLKPAKSRKNLHILSGAQAEALTFSGRQVTGIDFFHHNHRCHVRAGREVILCSGAIGTPHLLQLSGIGAESDIKSHGIEMHHALPGVGKNLQDHLQIRTIFKVKNIKTLNDYAETLSGKMRIGLEYLLKRSGPMSMAPSQLGAFVKSDAGLETPDLQYHVQPLSLDAFGQPLHPFSAFTASVCNLRPYSRGEVKIRSANPFDSPDIAPNYLSDAHDRKIAAQSIRLTRKIVGQKALSPYVTQEFLPGAEFETDTDLAQKAGDISTTIFHPVGTAKMGTDKQAVVDKRLAVHGLKGLRIADASVMPTITSGNTNSPTLMIAEKAADMILQDRCR
ncbi:MAG: GMC family oxidoreductase [Candidatus Puniceispirillaceae bacterium]